MAAWLDSCKFLATSTGTGDFVFASAVLGSQSPSLAGAVNTRVYKYRAQSPDQTQWEEGEGAHTSGTFARTTVLYNSSGTGTATGQSGAGTKISFSVIPIVGIVALKEDLISIEEANSFTTGQRQQARQNISTVLRSYLAGLTLSTAGATAVWGLTAGECADSTNVDLIEFPAGYAKTTTGWAAGSSSSTGSLDTGSIANSTWYHAYVIKNVTSGAVDALISLSATAPTMPSGFTLFRRVGSMKTNGSAQWTKFIQDGDNFTWDVPVVDVTVTNPGTAAVTRTLTCPLNVRTEATIVCYAQGTAGTDSAGGIYISDPSVADTAASANAFTFVQLSATAGTSGSGGWARVFTNTSSQVRSRLGQSTAGTFLQINTIGWVDRRGRDS